jgi:hypothetical protein
MKYSLYPVFFQASHQEIHVSTPLANGGSCGEFDSQMAFGQN